MSSIELKPEQFQSIETSLASGVAEMIHATLPKFAQDNVREYLLDAALQGALGAASRWIGREAALRVAKECVEFIEKNGDRMDAAIEAAKQVGTLEEYKAVMKEKLGVEL